MEFENVLGEKTKGYLLTKKIDGSEYYEGSYKSIELLCRKCFELGRETSVVDDVVVKELKNV